MELGRIGVWRRHQDGAGGLREAEQLGFGAVWVGSSPSLAQVRPFLEATERVPVLTGIVNVWRVPPEEAAAGHAELARGFPGRFALGIGVGHPEASSDYTRPLKAMRDYFDGLDAADPPVPPEERLAAALGPKMLDLAAERSLGTHPYFTPPEHTRFARERLGPGPLVAPEVAVVLETDPERAREIARRYAATYLEKRNYSRNLLRFGFTEADVRDGGSDRLIDEVIPHGPAEAVAEAVQVHFAAGADHVCLQPLGPGRDDAYRSLAAVLL